MRETIEQKAERLLAEGGLFVAHADGRTVRASCHGDHGRYTVIFDGRRWVCTCPARKTCSHVQALELITTPKRQHRTAAVADGRRPRRA
jgi:hypothetical protein